MNKRMKKKTELKNNDKTIKITTIIIIFQLKELHYI